MAIREKEAAERKKKLLDDVDQARQSQIRQREVRRFFRIPKLTSVKAERQDGLQRERLEAERLADISRREKEVETEKQRRDREERTKIADDQRVSRCNRGSNAL